MPSLNVLKNVNLAIERRGGTSCPNPALNPSASCGTNTLPYTVLSFDEAAQKWYPANEFGFYTASADTAGTITGSAYLLNINQNGCPYPAVYLSGSLSVPLNSNSVFMSIVTGSFVLSGQPTGQAGWSFTDRYTTTGSAEVFNYVLDAATNKNGLVGFALGAYVSPFNSREVLFYVSGSNVATNPPYTPNNYPDNLGATLTLSGVGIIRSFGTGYGTTAQQTLYNCLYGTTPSK
jgi:hypothetical protein